MAWPAGLKRALETLQPFPENNGARLFPRRALENSESFVPSIYVKVGYPSKNTELGAS